ncbi:NUDIX hydrolase [Mucilaginibacter sp.]|uniref:NUDIX hydrolase n=1 Tax=Mucilaginibacter sp. TaxID=1882438 RepID=UPI003AFFC7F8
MVISAELKEFFNSGYLTYIPHIYIDCVIFGYHNRKLKILLTKNGFLSEWCLPGGYMKRSESLQQAADRTIVDRTGIENLYLQQFRAFGDPNRTRYQNFDEEQWYSLTGLRLLKNNWLFDQTVSIGFFAITDFLKSIPSIDIESIESAWFNINELPELAMDHAEIVAMALKTLKIQLYHSPIGYNLLPEKFTLAEIQALYETLLEKKLDVSNFSKKLLTLGILEKANEKRNTSGHRSPYFYNFVRSNYEEALNEGIVLV